MRYGKVPACGNESGHTPADEGFRIHVYLGKKLSDSRSIDFNRLLAAAKTGAPNAESPVKLQLTVPNGQ